MTILEWIITIVVLVVLAEVVITILAKACRAVFDLESIEKEMDRNSVEKQQPTYITGRGKL